jgi:hypothetical protein
LVRASIATCIIASYDRVTLLTPLSPYLAIF